MIPLIIEQTITTYQSLHVEIFHTEILNLELSENIGVRLRVDPLIETTEEYGKEATKYGQKTANRNSRI